jgi:hypothetical protein
MAGSKFREGRLASLASAIDFLEIAPWNHLIELPTECSFMFLCFIDSHYA